VEGLKGTKQEEEEKDEITINQSEHICAPQLIGRAEVKLKFHLKNRGAVDLAQVTLIVDGINYPNTGGNFIDLCQKGVYNSSPVTMQQIDFGRIDEVVNFSVLGLFERDYWDPIRNRRRNIPLEIHREVPENNNRFTILGGAQNSAVFTTATPVQAFSTYGGIGMWHGPGDQNGASTAIFSAKLDRVAVRPTAMDKLPLLQRLDNRFSLFAYAVDGIEVLDQLEQGDILVSAMVEDGPWALVRL
jgi:cyclophilin family peptidyl-prolyl cis-trans isomerase